MLWDLASRRQVAEWPSRITTMKAMAFAPLGSLLAASQEDADGQAFLDLWEVAANQMVARLPHPSPVISVVFSPDGQLLATFAADRKVRLWNVVARRLITHFPASQATDSYAGVPRFSPDGQTLAIGETDGRVRLLDWKTGAEKGLPAPIPGEGVSALAFSPDASLLATDYAPSGTTHAANPDDYGILHIWNMQTTQEVRKLVGHRGGVSALAFTPDGKFLVSASLDQTLKVWDMTGENEVSTLRGHTHEVWDAVLAADRTTAVSCAKDGSIRFWDIPGKPVQRQPVTLTVPIQPNGGLAFTPDLKTFVTPNRDGSVGVWSLTNLGQANPLADLGTNNRCVAFSPDGQRLLAGDTAGNIKVYDWPGRRVLTNVAAGSGSIYLLAFDRSGELVWSVGRPVGNPRGPPLTCKIWRASTWQEAHPWKVSIPLDMRTGALSEDFRLAAIGLQDGTITWWDTVSGHKRGEFKGHSEWISQLAFSANSQRLASAGVDGTVRLWDLKSGRPGPRLRGYSQAALGVAFSPDGRLLATLGISLGKGSIRLLDTSLWRETLTLEFPGIGVGNLAFSPDGQVLMTAKAPDGTPHFWRAPSWAEIAIKEKEPKIP